MTKTNRTDVLFLRDIPADLKAHFKSACARRGVSMKDSVISHMRRVVAKDGELEVSRNTGNA